MLIQMMTVMELLQYAGPALKDLGLIDLNRWGDQPVEGINGFEFIYKHIWDILFDSKREIREEMIPIIEELQAHSVCGNDPKLLSGVLARIAGTLAFMEIAKAKNL